MATEKTCGHPAKDRVEISMTLIRDMIAQGIKPPSEVMRPEMAEILFNFREKLWRNGEEEDD
jgi:sulfate adenylyltransferase